MTFAEYLARRLAGELPEQDLFRDPVAERSMSGGLFKVVNPSRPVSPLNSKLLSGPFPKRLKSQVIAR